MTDKLVKSRHVKQCAHATQTKQESRKSKSQYQHTTQLCSRKLPQKEKRSWNETRKKKKSKVKSSFHSPCANKILKMQVRRRSSSKQGVERHHNARSKVNMTNGADAKRIKSLSPDRGNLIDRRAYVGCRMQKGSRSPVVVSYRGTERVKGSNIVPREAPQRKKGSLPDECYRMPINKNYSGEW
ncbi:uncharacterized protein BO97DRAFT_164623 [Aspergillus homomorphus CBS 101889]|uniref:Uncharacterized protein n=1 Tax=Aspergillus homomorphus (strain CBS 101889) TaxID=1450537 RepID=A0A395HQC5_ASPHC|nr:hypothetical protein BO97DRAFT_164623 [Aspergillus homomorphus CBS 101889]RAL09485.1 hypothetical protein BO97DRAFT_164623 [Aspergillus homomorphus CBS 101889]